MVCRMGSKSSRLKKFERVVGVSCDGKNLARSWRSILDLTASYPDGLQHLCQIENIVVALGFFAKYFSISMLILSRFLFLLSSQS